MNFKNKSVKSTGGRKMKKNLALLLGLVMFGMMVATPVFSQEKKDHHIISRYAGSKLIYYEQKNFDEFKLPMGKIKEGKFTRLKKVAGKITRITYEPEHNRSVFEVYKNYLNILQEKGAEILYRCQKDECGPDFGKAYFDLNPWTGRAGMDVYSINVVYHSGHTGLVAKVTGEKNDYYISFVAGSGYEPYTVYQLDIIEVKAMETGQVDALTIKADLEKKGHVSIYGIHFDTGESIIKAESAAIIGEIAKFLKDNPKKSIYIVGHTDNVGDFDSNMKLSKNRADAVLKHLVEKMGIAADRLKAYGVGPLSPVISNSSDKGKARNRRVDIVEQ
jgi:outer membrane protein OmpA-like peptidoglycan-associated protein